MIEFLFYLVPLFVAMLVYKRRTGSIVVWGPMKPILDGAKDSFLASFKRASST